MKCKLVGNEYKVMFDEERFPRMLDKAKTDEVLGKLKDAFDTINQVVAETYEKDETLYDFLVRHVFDEYNFPFNDGKCWRLHYPGDAIEEIQAKLAAHDDEVPEIEDLTLLSDCGYHMFVSDRYFWEKTIRDVPEEEVVDEVQFHDDNSAPLHRLRTIKYEKTDFGRASTEITYEDLPTDEALAKAIANTRRALKNGEDLHEYY